MDDIRARADVLGRRLALLAAYALAVGAISAAVNLGGAMGGEMPAIARLVLGFWGVAAGAMLWTGRRVGIDGWLAVMIWAVIQIPIYAWSVEGSPFAQVVEFPASFTSEVTVNGEVTSYSQVGINLAGVILVAWAATSRERWSLRGPRTAVAV